ncbi:hypothetical protein Tco_0240669 [Tanacetum coccineum]
MKIHNSPKILTRFEEYREVVKAKAARYGRRRDESGADLHAEALPTNDARVVVKFLRKTAYKSPAGNILFKIAYGKACHLPIEMKHKAYWALKNVNLDLDTAGKHRTKQFHDANIMDKESHEGEEVLIFNSRVEVRDKNGVNFKVNGHRLKKYYSGDINALRETLYFAKTFSQQVIRIRRLVVMCDSRGNEVAQLTICKNSIFIRSGEQRSGESFV